MDLFEDFLPILGTYCPDHFSDTVYMESTSYNWVLDRIEETFSLKTKGLGFLQGSALKFKYSPDSSTDTFTYQQGYMAIKEFYTSSLLNVGDILQNRVLDTKEVLSPMAHNFIVKKWLDYQSSPQITHLEY